MTFGRNGAGAQCGDFLATDIWQIREQAPGPWPLRIPHKIKARFCRIQDKKPIFGMMILHAMIPSTGCCIGFPNEKRRPLTEPPLFGLTG